METILPEVKEEEIKEKEVTVDNSVDKWIVNEDTMKIDYSQFEDPSESEDKVCIDCQ